MLPKEIYSLQHPLVKECVKIRNSKNFRFDKKQILLTQEKVILEISRFYPIDIVFYSSKKPTFGDQKIKVTDAILKKISGLMEPTNLCAIVKMPDLSQSFFHLPRILILDRLQDPGNMGTLLRTARGLNWDGVVITKESIDPFNDKVIRASMGTILTLPIAILEEKEILEICKKNNISILLADMQGKDLKTFKPHKSLALVLSSESHGLRFQEGEKISIKMENEVDSLNVAIAGGIFMHYLKR